MSQINKTLLIAPSNPEYIKNFDIKKKYTNVEIMYISSFIKKDRYTSFHNKFDHIEVLDTSLTDNEGWEIILDETIRFLKKKATIKLHIIGGLFASVWGIKSFISDKINIDVSLLSQNVISTNESIVVLKILKKNSKSKNWSIGIPSNGQKNREVLKLIRSVIKAKNYFNKKTNKDFNIEFIIVGDKDSIFKEYNVRFVNQSIDNNLPAIGEKKKLISTYSNYENILFIHDRYLVQNNFFLGFEKWGYDFEFCTVKQLDINNNFYDPILKLENFDRRNTQMYRLNQNFNYNFLYINGGLTIIKKSILKNVTFNPILLHHEAEDIDLARRLHNNGIIARYNNYSTAVTSIDVDFSNLKDVPPVINYYESLEKS